MSGRVNSSNGGRRSFSSRSCSQIFISFHKTEMCSIVLCGENIADFIRLHFKRQNARYFLIVNLKTSPQEGHWFPQAWPLGWNRQPNQWTAWLWCFAEPRARLSFLQHLYHHNSYTGPHQPLEWLVNCSESRNRTPVTDRCRLGDCGICVNISPRHLIHSLFRLLFRGAWSMRLDLQCNGIKHIVSHLWERGIEPINLPTPSSDLPSWKVDQKPRIQGGRIVFFSHSC